MNQNLQEAPVLKLNNSWNLVIIVTSFTVSLKNNNNNNNFSK